MLNIQAISVGMLQTNCYVAFQSGRNDCILVDPGDSARKILKFLEEHNLTPAAILLTHGHFDHDGAVKDLMQEYDCPVYMHEKEMSLPAGFPTGRRTHTHSCEEGDILDLAGIQLRVLHTPGHTPGSVCFQTDSVIFSGDTLFAGSCGRTDFPGGDPAQMHQSLHRLAALDEDFTVYPGHGEATTLSQERIYNPYL